MAASQDPERVPRPRSARKRRAVLCFLLGATAILGTTALPAADEPVVLRLKWWHQFQFAGYYAAQAKGYYAEEGITVRIEPAHSGQSSIDAVLAGAAHFGVSDADIIRARLEGRPIVACAAIFQHSPYVILSRRDRGIRKPSDLVGARVMMADSQGAIQLRAMMGREGINPGGVQIIPHSWRLDDLIEGRVDAMSAYATAEPPQLLARGVEPHLLRSIDYGVDFYGDTLFTTADEASAHPDRTAAFIRASLKGWDYALHNPGEIADLILKMEGPRARGATRESLLAEADAMMPFILHDIVEIGHMNPDRWRRIADTYEEFSPVPASAKDTSLHGFIFDPHPHDHDRLTRPLVRLGFAAAVLAALALLWNLQIRRRVRLRTRELAAEIAHRTRIEGDLRASEERFRLMFNGAATGIAILTPEGRYLQANPAYCTTTGYSEAELLKRDIAQLIHPEDRASYLKQAATLTSGACDHFIADARCMKKDGGISWKRASVSAMRTPEGRATGIILVTEDITARRAAEEAASASAELLRMASQIGGLGAWAIEYPGARVVWSDEVYRIHEVDINYRPDLEKALGFFPGDARRVLREAIAKGEPYDLELEFVTARGNRRWVRTTSAAEWEEGALKRLHGIFQDITDRKLAAEKLKASEAQYRLLFDENPHPMWVYDLATLGFLAVNHAAVEHYGYSEAEFLRMTLRDIRPPEEIASMEHKLTELRHREKSQGVWRHRKKNGDIIDVEISSDAIVFDGRQARLTLGTDVTARLRGERDLARLIRAQRMLSACNEALVRAETEPGLLTDICRLAVDIGGYRMAWVGYALHDENRTIRPVAHAGAEDGYLSEVTLSWAGDQPGGRGPAGRTIRDNRTTLCADIETDEGAMLHWRDEARRHGYRGFVCLPLRGVGGGPLGLLCLHSGEVLDVNADESRLLQQLADNLAFGLTAIRARIERQKTQDAVLTVARGVSAAIGDAFFQQLTRSMVAALGADIGVIVRLNAERDQAGTLSVVVDGVRLDNFSYALAGTPCETISAGEPCVVSHDVQQRFPAFKLLADLGAQAYVGHPLIDSRGVMIGVMAVMFRQPLEQTDFIASTLQIFATRAASEIDRQQADSRVREQAALLDKAQDAILVRDLDHHVTYWNKSAERLYGWTAQEAVGRSIATLLYKDATAFHQATRQVVSKGEWVGELHQINKSGDGLVVECRWTLVRDEDGAPHSILAINTDITEKKKLEHQFLRAQRMESIGTLAGGIAHDLNNVLAPVIMAIDLLKLEESDPRRLSLLNTVAASARRGADMVGQVLSFARGMDGRRIEVQARHLVHDIEKIAQDTFPKNIQIESRAPADLWPVVGDPTQLHQVLLNLCVNARDAMPAGGRLLIAAENVHLDAHYASMNIEAKAGPHVVLHVEDTGTGIPAAVIEKIFDPFFTTKEVGKGTGLGLSTTLAIVKSHGGFIRVYSEEHKGTRFRVHLPALPDEARAAAAAPEPKLPRGSGETILVIDDEASIRQITRQTLEAFGYRVMLASDGAEGVAVYAAHRDEISAVLIDMMMPVMDGAAAIPVLMKINPAARIVAASGISANAATARAAGTGVKQFLPKPYTADKLLKALRLAIEAPPA